MRTAVIAVSTFVAFGLVAGCGDNPTTEGPSTVSPTSAYQAASCVVGDWRSTGISGDAGGEAGGGRISGGGGVALRIERNGATTADFSDMQPVTFTLRLTGSEAAGRFTYHGRVSGTIVTRQDEIGSPTATDRSPTTGPKPTTPAPTTPGTPTATGTPTTTATGAPDATSGTGTASGAWEPVGQTDWRDLRVTLDLTEPVQARPLDNAPIGRYAAEVAEQTGGIVDVEPMLGFGRYRCEGDTLILNPDDDRGTTWTFERS